MTANAVNFLRMGMRRACANPSEVRALDAGDAITSPAFPNAQGYIEDVEVDAHGNVRRYHVAIGGVRAALLPGRVQRAHSS